MNGSGKLIRIGVFYDGQYFFNVSNFYNYQHQRKSRVSISGLHDFVRAEVSAITGTDIRLCQIVDAHYFRGRFSARESDGKNKLLSERLFEDILMYENVVSHYLPLKYDKYDKPQEKGIDVWLALECYECALHKQFDVVCLIACDGDYVPLVRKLHTLGAKVMLISWDYRYTDEYGNARETRTSHKLLEAASYKVLMHDRINADDADEDAAVRNLFVSYNRIAKAQAEANEDEDTHKEAYDDTEDDPPVPADGAAGDTRADVPAKPPSARSFDTYTPHGYVRSFPSFPGFTSYECETLEDGVKTSTILVLKDSYGFIKEPAFNNVYFNASKLEGIEFSELEKGMFVNYTEELKYGKHTATRVWPAEGDERVDTVSG
ncbi:MAG: NYN domain-containing protein [Clostridiales bacterium]|nr:NYN domain-containing protein [Clostridiales bacterium]